MPIVLEQDPQGDLDAEALEMAVSEGDPDVVAAMETMRQPLGEVGDLSRGGKVGPVNIYPNPARDSTGKMTGKGRPTVRQAWMWDGTESYVPLSWNPEGTVHDGGRAYLAKKHCHCCGFSGFKFSVKLRGCPQCIKSNCRYCRGGQDRSKIIPCFYFNKDKVPYPKELYGPVDCFVPVCVRRGEKGFKNETDMRMHARSKHRAEYATYLEMQQAQRADKTAELEQRVNALTTALLARGQEPPQAEPAPQVGTPEAPLYISDKPKRQRRKAGSIQ